MHKVKRFIGTFVVQSTKIIICKRNVKEIYFDIYREKIYIIFSDIFNEILWLQLRAGTLKKVKYTIFKKDIKLKIFI